MRKAPDNKLQLPKHLPAPHNNQSGGSKQQLNFHKFVEHGELSGPWEDPPRQCLMQELWKERNLWEAEWLHTLTVHAEASLVNLQQFDLPVLIKQKKLQQSGHYNVLTYDRVARHRQQSTTS